MKTKDEIAVLKAELAAMQERVRHLALENEITQTSERCVMASDLTKHLLIAFQSPFLAIALIHAQADPSTRHHEPITVEKLHDPAYSQREQVYYAKETLDFISALCQKYLEPENQAVVFRAEMDVAILINPVSQYISDDTVQSGAYTRELKWALSNILASLDKELGFQSIVTLSSIVREPFNLHTLYMENKYAYDYIWDQVGGVHSYTDLNASPMSAKDLARISTLEQEFMDNVSRALYPGAAEVLERILQRQFEHTVPLHEIITFVTAKFRNILAVMGYTSDLTSGYMAELTILVQQVSASASIPELRDRIQDFFASIADFTPNVEDGKGEQVLTFIRNNYKNLRLNAQLICDRFRISRAYLSVLVKKKTGQGLVGLVHTLRVDAAKDLIRNTRIPIEQISQQVGFSSRYTLLRAFRESTGMAPSEYRTKNIRDI